MIITVSITDKEKFGQYGEKAGPTLAQFGGELLIHGTHARALYGGSDHSISAVIRFPDQASLQAWHDSPAYQDLVPLRTSGGDFVLTAYDTIK